MKTQLDVRNTSEGGYAIITIEDGNLSANQDIRIVGVHGGTLSIGIEDVSRLIAVLTAHNAAWRGRRDYRIRES